MPGVELMTEKLFYQDYYLKQAKAKVIKIDGNKLYLDQTIFWAFSGGQQSDSGSISGVPVVNVYLENNDIVHEFELGTTLPFNEGNEVELKIDWSKRYRIMKLHAATHIAYHFFRQKTGITKLIGSNITVDKGRFDFDSGTPISEALLEIEAQTNEFIQGNHEIVLTEDEEIKGKRWWNCGEMKMPCGGLHVKKTLEIGLISLKRKNIGKGKERIEIHLKG